MTALCPVQGSKFDVQGSTVPALVSVCMLCHRTIGPDQFPRSEYIEPGAIVSHGICLACAPGYCASMGLTPSETARIISSNSTANNSSD